MFIKERSFAHVLDGETSEQLSVRDAEVDSRESRLFVLVGPTASGKTTILSRLCEKFPQVKKLVSFTTRDRREREVDGIDYHFISEHDFQDSREDFVFVTDRKMDNRLVHYGVHRSSFDQILNGGSAVMQMDLQSSLSFEQELSQIYDVATVKRIMDYVQVIYIGVPRLTILKDRYRSRHRKGEEQTAFLERLKNEWKTWNETQDRPIHVVMNVGDIDTVVQNIMKIA